MGFKCGNILLNQWIYQSGYGRDMDVVVLLFDLCVCVSSTSSTLRATDWGSHRNTEATSATWLLVTSADWTLHVNFLDKCFEMWILFIKNCKIKCPRMWLCSSNECVALPFNELFNSWEWCINLVFSKVHHCPWIWICTLLFKTHFN